MYVYLPKSFFEVRRLRLETTFASTSHTMTIPDIKTEARNGEFAITIKINKENRRIIRIIKDVVKMRKHSFVVNDEEETDDSTSFREDESKYSEEKEDQEEEEETSVKSDESSSDY